MAVTAKEIQCDNFATCGNARMRAGSLQFALESARVHGYHIWMGYTIGGQKVAAVLCGECIGSHRRPPRKIAPLEGDQPLF